jgi:hypothetical protein
MYIQLAAVTSQWYPTQVGLDGGHPEETCSLLHAYDLVSMRDRLVVAALAEAAHCEVGEQHQRQFAGKARHAQNPRQECPRYDGRAPPLESGGGCHVPRPLRHDRHV